jgi:hypothetical protein
MEMGRWLFGKVVRKKRLEEGMDWGVQGAQRLKRAG